jgi:hypothetical protein
VAGGDDIAPLYAGPLGDFIRARNSLAQRLAAEGNRDAAAAVKQLKKPTVTAWAVNQLAHHHSDRISELVDATERVRHAADANELRAATKDRNRVISSLVDLGSDLLEAAGHGAGPAQAEKITQTLLAGSSADEYREELVEGRVTKELQPAGFEDAWTLPAGSIDEQASEEEAELDEARRAAEELADAAAQEERTAAQLEREAEDAELAAEAARRAASRARAKAGAARQRADDALASLTESRR